MAIKKDIQLNIVEGKKSDVSIDMTGKRFGRLLVLKFIGVHRTKRNNLIAMVQAKCDCGSIHNYQSRHLREGKSKSCGCYQAEFSSNKHTKHGQKSPKHGKRGTILYARWRSMFDRLRSDSNYATVKICERWKGENGFLNFCADMGEMPTLKHTVDRYPIIKGDYEPTNTRWATMKEQMQNVTKNVNYVYNGELLCVSEISRRCGVGRHTIDYRIKKLKWTIEQATTYPVIRGMKYTKNKKVVNDNTK